MTILFGERIPIYIMDSEASPERGYAPLLDFLMEFRYVGFERLIWKESSFS